ncbi:MAG: ABC transporter permease, partial [Bacteroidales bacterium]|nr:ABC transporter permease [Bacteroidales bacterium]
MKNPKTPKILNLLGLAVALAVFMILMAQVRYDRRYNRCFADSERMYRVEVNTDNQGYSHWMVGSDKADYLDSLDEVESVYQFDLIQQADIKYCNPVLANSVEDVGELSFGTIYSTQFFDFFGYQCVDGSFSDFDRDDEIVIPESLAKKVFPKESAIGKTLLLNDNYFGEDTILKQKIVAVYKDMPQNNSFGNPLLFIETPQLAYNVVEINQDSIRALWDGDGEFETEVWGVGQNCTPDSLFVEVFLYSKAQDDTTKVDKEKYVRVRATCDPNDPAPALVKDTMKMPNPWGSLYCKLKSGADPNAIAAKLKERFYSSEDLDDEPCEVRLMAVNDIHFEDDAVRYNKQEAVSRFVVNCLAGIAWVVLIIAFLNFANFAIAEAPLRMRRVNTRKVLGESDGGIWWSMAKGYIVLSLVAFLIAFIVFLFCTRLPEIPMLSNPVTLSGNVSIILMTLLLSIVVGVIVSVYPTRMVTVVSPDVALKGSYGFSKTGRRLRTLFIGLQFFLASVILTCTLYVAVQNRYLKTYDMGYQTHNILNFDADFRKLDSIEPYIHALEQLSGVEDVTASSWPIVRNSGYVLYGRKLVSPDSAKTQVVEFHAMHV